MADQPGFLASLGVSPVDEKDQVTAQRDSLLNDQRRAAQAQGRTAGRGVAGLLAGAGSIVRNRSLKGAGKAALTGFNEATDRDVAEASGLTVDQLQGRRLIRQLSTDGANSGSYEDRINLARRIASIANQHGDSDVLGAALKRVTDLRTEKEEFDKLQATTIQEESTAEDSDVISAFLDGEPIEGVQGRDAEGRKGLHIADREGNTQFHVWGERLTKTDKFGAIAGGRSGRAPGMTDAELISKTLGKSSFNEIRASVTANRGVLRKYDTVLSRLADAAIRGNVQSVIGDAGSISTFLDNTVRSIRGVLGTFAPGDTFAQDSDLLTKYRNKTERPNDAIWEVIALPSGVEFASAEAQQYRAAIVELAYLSARAAEPSNRGLSDNDIKNALLRLGADSANPAVLFRRSMEIVATGANDINDRLDNEYGAHQRRDGTMIEDAKIDSIFAGKGLAEYRNDIAELYKKFDVTILADGRAQFGESLDVDVPPLAPDSPPEPITLDDLKEALLALPEDA